jgi:hypothetical protein
MAEDGARSAGQDRGHPVTVLRQLPPTDRVHAAPDRMKASLRYPVIDGMPAEPELEQLLARHDAVLPRGERPDRRMR